MTVPVDAYQSMRKLLAEVSRSFFLSLRALPGRMRSPVSLAYLLARASDTLADCEGPCPERRIQWLDGFIEDVRDGGLGPWFAEARDALVDHPHDGERRLIGRLGECLDCLTGLPPSQATYMPAEVQMYFPLGEVYFVLSQATIV